MERDLTRAAAWTYLAHTSACTTPAPRLSSPSNAPATTSPLPEVPRPVSPVVTFQTLPSAAAQSAHPTTAPYFSAASSAASANS